MKSIALLFSLLLVALVGCTSYPMGLTKEQWAALSPEQQSDYNLKQSQLDEQKRQANEAQLQEQRNQMVEQDRQANMRLAAIYANPQYGDIIVVTIADGEIGIGGRRQRYQPVQFELARGEVKEIAFRREDNPYLFRQIQMQFSQDGGTFTFDPSMKQIQIRDDGWKFGRTYHPPAVNEIDVFSGAKDIKINIRFKHLPFQHNSSN